ncbi:MAG: FAD-dependent oxidoreductase, partial [Verrucomicrobia bacterium]|nr:FAD-dependent oxidoreductase [Verrucomicrobiota bacterium]
MKTSSINSFQIHPEALPHNASSLSASRRMGHGLLLVTLLGQLCLGLAHGQPQRQTPIAELRDSYDLVIAGAGTGGFGAAVQAARLGATVLLLEETDWIGGQMNAAAVTSMDEGPRNGDRPYVLVRERG